MVGICNAYINHYTFIIVKKIFIVQYKTLDLKQMSEIDQPRPNQKKVNNNMAQG